MTSQGLQVYRQLLAHSGSLKSQEAIAGQHPAAAEPKELLSVTLFNHRSWPLWLLASRCKSSLAGAGIAATTFLPISKFG